MILASDIGFWDIFWIVPLSFISMGIALFVQQAIGFKDEPLSVDKLLISITSFHDEDFYFYPELFDFHWLLNKPLSIIYNIK